MAEAEAGKRGQGADREVADDRQEFLVAEDPLWAAFFVGSYRLAQQGGAGGVGEPLLESGHAAEPGRRGGGGGGAGGGGGRGALGGGGGPQVAGGGADGKLEPAALQQPVVQGR